MKSILQSFNYLRGYQGRVILNVILTVIVAALEIVSLLSVVPFLRLVFNKNSNYESVSKPESFQLFPISDVRDNLEAHFQYVMYNITEQYSNIEVLTFICIAVFLTFLLKNIFIYANKMVERSILYNVAKDVRSSVYNKVLMLPLKHFTEQRRGNILTLFSNDILRLESSVLNGYMILFKEPITILFYLITMLLISTKLTLFILILIPTLGLLIGQISKSLRRKSGDYQNQLSKLTSFLDETLFGAKVIKSFTGERFVSDRFEKENYRLKRIHKKIHIRRAASSPISEVMGIGLVMIVLWYGGSLILGNAQNSLSGELLIFFLLLFSQMISPIKALSNQYSVLQDGLASADRIETFLERDIEYEEFPPKTIKPRFDKQVVFNDVTFLYPHTDKVVLDNFNLTLKKGTVTAIVGQSGAGKSTVADLLPHFYEVTDGEILIDGKNINELPLQELRSLFSYVSQEAILFNDTVANNIAFGMENAREDEIIRAAKIANAHGFIEQLEQGYKTNIGERGSKLSGGQRQRLTIARAILKDAPILILDEATSALDTESERLVQDAINRLLENRTALVIAHRLSTVKNADSICVMVNGKIIEQGTHEQLLQKEDGHYKTLTELQTV